MILALVATAVLAHTPNADLRDTVLEQPWRVAPRGETYATAVDTRLNQAIALNASLHPGFYHSFFLNELYGEVEPFEHWVLNLRLSLGVASYSYGATAAGYVHPWPALSYGASGDRVSARARLGDLDRQTLGAGLTLEEKELSGARGQATVHHLGPFDARAIVMWAGTGGFDVEGDAKFYALEPLSDRLGLYLLSVAAGGNLVAKQQPVCAGAYAKWTHGILRWGLEGARRNHAWAGLVRVGVEGETERVSGALGVHGRAFESGWAKGLHIQQDYLAPEQEDKSAFDTVQFLVDHRAGTMVGGDLQLGWVPIDQVRIHGRYEVARTEGAVQPGLPVQHRFLAELALRPLGNPAIETAVHLTNKTSAAIALPAYADFRAVPAFSDQVLLRFEVRMAL